MELKFSGSKALITGGTSELGICVSKLMIQAGLFPILTYRNEKGKKIILKSLKEHPGSFSTVLLNFSDPSTIVDAFKEFKDDIDYLIDIAHTDYENLIPLSGSDDIQDYFKMNISIRSDLIKRASRAMLKKKKGRLIFVSSSAANRSSAGQGFYAASKLASEALYRNLGIELGSRGITTVMLRPGYIDIGRGKKYLEKNMKDALNKIPIKRVLKCEEVAETIMFFMSDSANGFNATEITLDGGMNSVK